MTCQECDRLKVKLVRAVFRNSGLHTVAGKSHYGLNIEHELDVSSKEIAAVKQELFEHEATHGGAPTANPATP